MAPGFLVLPFPLCAYYAVEVLNTLSRFQPLDRYASVRIRSNVKGRMSRFKLCDSTAQFLFSSLLHIQAWLLSFLVSTTDLEVDVLTITTTLLGCITQLYRGGTIG
ncbi:hypothetical protein BKA83DRAFT_1150713 [Pisolithus microcarpus]|nr:hypothetical protein BKA83DRAFT_1150713 [Pisolithus microcarpus]